ncbi:NHL repeat-containing protein [Nannocystis exedens]|uniref:NHL repeat-containing protein n=1 Tax=Nannocystis exedens TaxID=54 RepID=A0A1I1VNY4_9BACT|nr:SMP-30/gluconolactonase/LRE family protein [Nannocystis exedens]PCC72704.1 Ig domain-containing protein [Nannocystis exedens]SFD84651.1 NHL repeat-containing protein [Nannocystis exedens]
MTRSQPLLSLLAVVALASACDSDGPPPCPTTAGTICTWAGDGEAGFNGDDEPLSEARFYWPADVTITRGGQFYILDYNNHQVRLLTEEGTLKTVMGTDFVGDGPFDLSDLTQPGSAGTDINLNHPTQMLEEAGGTLLLVSWHNHKIRRYDPKTGKAYVICGRGAGYAGDGGRVDDPDARLNQPSGGVLDEDGNLYLLDQRNQRIRLLSADGSMLTTVAGSGEMGYDGDGGAPMAAKFHFPPGSNPPPAGTLALDAEGRLYVADTLNHAIRRVDFAADTIETVAGTGEAGYGGDGGPGTAAKLNNPRDIEFGPDGRLYIADELNHRVRALDVESGVITTVAGNGRAEFSGDRGPAVDAGLNRPTGVAFDADGTLYISDSHNHRVRTVVPGK